MWRAFLDEHVATALCIRGKHGGLDVTVWDERRVQHRDVGLLSDEHGPSVTVLPERPAVIPQLNVRREDYLFSRAVRIEISRKQSVMPPRRPCSHLSRIRVILCGTRLAGIEGAQTV